MPPVVKNADSIARSTRSDLYLAIVAPVGIERESFHAALKRELVRFGYGTHVIRLSELMKSFKDVMVDLSTEEARLRTAMDAGSWLRENLGADLLARAAMADVHRLRESSGPGAPPTAYVLWSLKHPEEVATLRLVYGGSFHAIGLFATEAARVEALKSIWGLEAETARAHVDRDRAEEDRKNGQRTRDTFHRADVFLAWPPKPGDMGLARYIEILFGCLDKTPTADEHRMFLAYASALRSGELSRQVGAVLVSAEGDVLSVGANDVPRRGGGLYWPTEDDDRDIIRKEDANARVRGALLMDVARELCPEGDTGSMEVLAARLASSRLKEITEYGRAVHAEMEALLACARSGRSTRGATLYVTTYPCHNCARHHHRRRHRACRVRRALPKEPRARTPREGYRRGVPGCGSYGRKGAIRAVLGHRPPAVL